MTSVRDNKRCRLCLYSVVIFLSYLIVLLWVFYSLFAFRDIWLLGCCFRLVVDFEEDACPCLD